MSSRILHVTETPAYGVLDVIGTISRRQAEAGAEVTAAYVRRPDTPSTTDLSSRFSSSVKLREVSPRTAGPRRLAALLLFVYRSARSGDYDVIHLHSSIAGAVGRLACLGTKTRVVYSPHGWSFHRVNVGVASRAVAFLVEALLARFTDRLLVSTNDELATARRRLRSDASVLLTGVRHELSDEPRRQSSGLPRVGMVGRIAYQKAPWRFNDVAQRLQHMAHFVWVGQGSTRDTNEWIDRSAVELIPWLSSADLAKEVSSFDLILFPSLWEGKPLALMQAQVQGVPAVTSAFGGANECVRDGITGFVCESEDELEQRVRQLLSDSALRNSMGESARAWGQEFLTDATVGTDSLRLYGVML